MIIFHNTQPVDSTIYSDRLQSKMDGWMQWGREEKECKIEHRRACTGSLSLRIHNIDMYS